MAPIHIAKIYFGKKERFIGEVRENIGETGESTGSPKVLYELQIDHWQATEKLPTAH